MVLRRRFDAAVKACPVVAIFRWHEGGRVLVDVAQALTAGGIRLVEITMNTPGVDEAIRAVRRRRDAAPPPPASAAGGAAPLIGAGTVLGPDDAARAVDAGAEFLVTPVVDEPTVAWAKNAGVPILVGALTPTEALRAWRAGATAVKIFPIDPLGPGYIAGLKAPLDMLPLVPTGGITLAQMPGYLRAGAVAVGVGPTLIDPTRVEARDWSGITDAARQWVAAAREATA